MGNDWKVGKQQQNGTQKAAEYAVLVGVITQDQTEAQVEEYLDELEFLAEVQAHFGLPLAHETLGRHH